MSISWWQGKRTVKRSCSRTSLLVKEQATWRMQPRGWISESLCSVIEARHKRIIHSIWFHLCDILKKRNCRNRNLIRGCGGLGTWGGDPLQRDMRELLEVKEVCYILAEVVATFAKAIYLKIINCTVYKLFLNKFGLKRIIRTCFIWLVIK